MADAVTTQLLQDGDRVAVLKFTNVSDGTGESAVTKLDLSADLAVHSRSGLAPNRVSIRRIVHNCSGMQVQIIWEGTTDNSVAWVCSGIDDHDFEQEGPLRNNAPGDLRTGDILFTTLNHSSNDTYSVVLELVKKYQPLPLPAFYGDDAVGEDTVLLDVGEKYYFDQT